ncbi:MAG: type II secretion system protein J [Pirellulaceae bacterium]
MILSYTAKPRPAFTLIEVVTTLTLGSLMSVLAVGLVHRTFQAHKLSQARFECCQRWDALGNQFRRDVWSSKRAELVDAQSLILEKDNVYAGPDSRTRIEYRIRGNRLTRTSSLAADAGGTEEGSNSHREFYPLLPNEIGRADEEQVSQDTVPPNAEFEKSGSKIILKLHRPLAPFGFEPTTKSASSTLKRTFAATLSRWIVGARETTNTSPDFEVSP